VKSVAIDFDGVVHAYTRGWQGGVIYDEPVEGVFDAIRHFQAEGHPVFIFTSRDNLEAVANWITARSGLTVVFDDGYKDPFWDDLDCLLVTNRKLGASVYIDDRGYRFTDWVNALAEVKL
jgi:hypothetical protein